MIIKVVSVIFSQVFEAKRSRIRRIPKLIDDTVLAFSKRDALRLMKNFHDGIKQNSFRLKRLQDGTIERKRSMAMEKPNVPLYGAGDSKKKNSFVNMLRMRKVKAGYKVFASNAKHHSADLKLKDLLDVHEKGRIISRGDALIRIPPRPAFEKAFKRTLKQRRVQEDAADVRRAYTAFMNTGSDADIKAIQTKAIAGLKQFEGREE